LGTSPLVHESDCLCDDASGKYIEETDD
jgi:hypothetical protein